MVLLISDNDYTLKNHYKTKLHYLLHVYAKIYEHLQTIVYKYPSK